MESSPISSKFNRKKVAGCIRNATKAAKFCKMDLMHFFCKYKMNLKFLIYKKYFFNRDMIVYDAKKKN